jgi:type I restriction enzyme, S subunit
MMGETKQQLPKGWVEATIDDIAIVEAGNPAPQGEKYFEDGKYPFVRVQDMGRLNSSPLLRVTKDKLNDKGIKGLKLFVKGCVLFTKSGASTLLNQRAILGQDSYIVSHIGVAILKGGISSEWIFYWLKIIDFAHYAHGANMPSMPLSKAKEIKIPLASLNEQKRIMDKIERLFSDLDEGEALLKTVQKQLATYRQSVLKAAVTGELTKDWREQNKHRLESGENLLNHILKNRRDNWNGQGKYKEPATPNVTGDQGLPEKWCWCTIEQLSFVATGATPKKGNRAYYDPGTIPWITSTAVNQNPIIHYQELITELALKETNVKIIPKGALIMAMYGEGKTRGSVSELGIDAGTNQACAALICSYTQKDTKDFLKMFLEYNYEIIRLESAGGVQPNLNLGIVKETVLPLPPLDEQELIVDQVSDILSQIDTLQDWCATELARSNTLRQSILKDAFSGKLVPQDPKDEPASELLKRIQAERETKPKIKTTKNKKKKTKAA